MIILEILVKKKNEKFQNRATSIENLGVCPQKKTAFVPYNVCHKLTISD